MAREEFDVEIGYSISEGNGDKLVSILSGTAIPDGLNKQAEVNIGSLYIRSGTGELYQKIANVGAAGDWELFGVDTLTVEASENLDAGDFVNIFDDLGIGKCRKADNSNDRAAVGFVLAAVTSGNNATVYFEGTNTALAGMAPGARQYLGTAGDRTETPVSGSGTIHQFLGVARSATELPFEANESVVNE